MTDPDPRQPDYSWNAHPAREHVGRAVLGIVVILGLAAMAGILMQSTWWTVFVAFLMLAILNRFFLPSRFEIDGEGITARYPLQRKRARWADLKRFVHDDSAGFLSTRAKRSWAEASRGIHVFFGPERDSVLEQIRSHLPEGSRSWAH